METEKLYYADPFLREFTARVVSCTADGGAYRVTLDRTAFYPESGGQGADHGTLSGVAVTDVHERDGSVVHTCAGPLPVGETVSGTLDWARRFDHMQQHSGEHVLSGILCRRFSCDNVGFHLGADTVTIDYNADISWEEALSAEAEANALIAADAPVEITFPDAQTLSALDYRSKKALTGQVRIVTFPGADCCACCGTHVSRAGQAGPVKVLSAQKFRQGTRLEIVCGLRALALLGAAYEQARAVGQSLSVKPLGAAAAVERTLSELSAAKARCAQLEEQLFSLRAAQYAKTGDALLVEPAMTADSARRLADAVAKACGGLATVFAGSDEAGYHYALVRADGGDLTALVKALNAALHGRGGGRGGFAQGSAQTRQADIEAFFARQG